MRRRPQLGVCQALPGAMPGAARCGLAPSTLPRTRPAAGPHKRWAVESLNCPLFALAGSNTVALEPRCLLNSTLLTRCPHHTADTAHAHGL